MVNCQTIQYFDFFCIFINFFFYLKKIKTAKYLSLIFLILFLFFCVFPAGKFLIYSLEKNYHNPFIYPKHVDGILILAGATNIFLTKDFEQINLNSSAERLTEAIQLIRKYKNAKVIFSGGTGSIKKIKLNHADVARKFFHQIAKDLDNRIIFEKKSKNTYESIVFSKNIANPLPDEIWLVITSAFHMNRTIFISENNNWRLMPYAVDFRHSSKLNINLEFNFWENLKKLEIGLHEWVGLIAYYLMGRTGRIL